MPELLPDAMIQPMFGLLCAFHILLEPGAMDDANVPCEFMGFGPWANDVWTFRLHWWFPLFHASCKWPNVLDTACATLLALR